VTDDLTELINFYRDKAGHARRCFEANSTLVINATPRGSSVASALLPVTLLLRFTYVIVPHMTSVDPVVMGNSAASSVTSMK
jgi:hypothetical protein